MRQFPSTLAVAWMAVVGFAFPVLAKEYPIGQPQTLHGMEVAAVYLQPIEMEPANMMRAVADSDVHLEADIHASADNKNGFADGAWLPSLAVHYELSKVGGGTISGELMPMVADDGPHYGDNVKLLGPGTYKLRLTVQPPNSTPSTAHFGRHVDKETGVGPWFEKFSVDYDFVFAGTGKKGAY